MATKQKAVKPSSTDVKTICWLASKKAITSITPVGKTTMVYRLEYKGTYDISFSGVRARRKVHKTPEYDINIDISELKDRELIMLAACGFPIVFATKGPANKNPVGTIYRVKNTEKTVRELDSSKYHKLLYQAGAPPEAKVSPPSVLRDWSGPLMSHGSPKMRSNLYTHD